MVLLHDEIDHWSTDCLWIVADENVDTLRGYLSRCYTQLTSQALDNLANFVNAKSQELLAGSHSRVLLLPGTTLDESTLQNQLANFLCGSGSSSR